MTEPDPAAAVLAGLDPEQRAAAEAVRGPVCILAGAGTGKTRAITHRIAYAVHSGAVPVEHLLAVTFTIRAAGEMRGRLRAPGRAPGAGPNVPQRGAASAAVLRAAHPRRQHARRRRQPDAAGRQRRGAGSGSRVDRAETARSQRPRSTGPRPCSRLRRPTPSGPWRPAARPRWPRPTSRRSSRSTSRPRPAQGVIDFADLLMIMAAGIEEFAGRRRAGAPPVPLLRRRRVPGRLAAAAARARRAGSGERDDLCVVGDANQTIYSFAGATPQHLLRFRRRFPSAAVVRLERDYRSTPQVVELANGLVGRGGAEADAASVSARPGRRRPSPSSTTNRPRRPTSPRRLPGLIGAGTPAAEIAVLFRVNAQSEVYEQAFSSAGVPYVLRGGERFFDRPEIREARLLLRGAARSGGDEDRTLTDAVRVVLIEMNWHAERRRPAVRRASGGSRWPRWSPWPRTSAGAQPRRPAGAVRGRTRPARRRPARAHGAGGHARLAARGQGPGVGRRIPRRADRHHAADPARHARPSNWPRSAGCSTSASPGRARRLALSWALARSPGQRRGAGPAASSTGCVPRARRPSRARLASASRRRPRTPRCSAGCARGARRRPSRQKVPPYVVFSDATLVAIADNRPGSAGRRWPGSAASGRPSSTATPSRCSPCSAAPTPTRASATSNRPRGGALDAWPIRICGLPDWLRLG